MPEGTPADAAGGQEPAGGEGKTPAAGTPAATDPQEGKETQTYPESYVKQLRKEASGHRARTTELENRLKEIEDRDKSEATKLAEELTATKRERDEEKNYRTRVEVARERGLDLKAVDLLSGSTREEIELRAEQLTELLKERGSKPSAGFDGGARAIVPETRPPAEAHNDLLLRSLGMQRRET